jgi:small GTP-binding protein
MLRQVYIIKDNRFLYESNFGKSIDRNDFAPLFTKLKLDALSSLGENYGDYEYYKYRINYLVEKQLKLFFIFITGLADNPKDVQMELDKIRKEFMSIFGDMLELDIDPTMFEVLAPTIDVIHKNLRPKISLIGFSGVGKTTITRLIRSEEIPMEHVPTITGDIATIRIGKLHFHLWDFAGQEQFSFLWNKFVKGSDGILLITNSELENIEKSKFFLELIKDEAPYAHAAVIGNKQDLPGALPIAKIEEILNLKTYSMVAIDPENRDKMIQIIADILEMSSEISPLLKPLFDRD